MNDLLDRDERFAVAFGRWWNGVANKILAVAALFLPRHRFARLAIFFIDTAEGVGKAVGAVYVFVRNVEDFVRWLVGL